MLGCIFACVFVREIREKDEGVAWRKKRREEDRLKSCIPTQCNSDQLYAVPSQLIYKKDSTLVDPDSMYHPPPSKLSITPPICMYSNLDHPIHLYNYTQHY
jgi:hypothetical protein